MHVIIYVVYSCKFNFLSVSQEDDGWRDVEGNINEHLPSNIVPNMEILPPEVEDFEPENRQKVPKRRRLQDRKVTTLDDCLDTSLYKDMP